jgi:phage terminase large subunit-like protein
MVQVRRSDLQRIVLGIDPAVTANEDSDDTGIVVVARGPHQSEHCKVPYCPGHGYVLDDRTCHLAPADWAKLAVQVYDEWQADRIVAEVNNGGDMVGTVIHAVRAGLPYRAVHATRGKRVRAEPASALSEQGRIHFLGVFPQLEDELSTWDPASKDSPNRLDALVWGLAELGLIGDQGAAFMTVMQDATANTPMNPTPRELRGLPTPTDDETPTDLRPGCAHRWKDGQCVFCGGSKHAPSN